jgi:hypothetical protein
MLQILAVLEDAAGDERFLRPANGKKGIYRDRRTCSTISLLYEIPQLPVLIRSQNEPRLRLLVHPQRLKPAIGKSR